MGEVVWEGQLLHVFDVVAPIAFEYVLATQLVQIADPTLSLYFAGTHSTHGPPFGPLKP